MSEIKALRLHFRPLELHPPPPSHAGNQIILAHHLEWIDLYFNCCCCCCCCCSRDESRARCSLVRGNNTWAGLLSDFQGRINNCNNILASTLSEAHRGKCCQANNSNLLLIFNFAPFPVQAAFAQNWLGAKLMSKLVHLKFFWLSVSLRQYEGEVDKKDDDDKPGWLFLVILSFTSRLQTDTIFHNTMM